MRYIKPYYEIIGDLDGQKILNHIEYAGRTCYKSEPSEGSAERFCRMIIKHGHESVLEHISFTVKFVTDRAVTHEIVRHRLASYSQESQRYCNYCDDKFNGKVTFIIPHWADAEVFATMVNEGPDKVKRCTERKLFAACEIAGQIYEVLLRDGLRPEDARAILPNCTKTELVMTANIREWRHFLKLRTSKAAHPDLKALTIPLLKDLQARIPVLFDDIEVEA